MKLEQINNFEKTNTQLQSLYDELSALSKKSANDGLNKFKLTFINKSVAEANEILGSTYIPYKEFTQFDEQMVPTNSDVAMILGQYLNCMEKLRADNIIQDFGDWVWQIEKSKTIIRTSPPKKISNK